MLKDFHQRLIMRGLAVVISMEQKLLHPNEKSELIYQRLIDALVVFCNLHVTGLTLPE